MNQAYQEFAHCSMMLFQCCSSAARICAGSLFSISRRTITTMSRGGKRCWFLRKLSRNSRFKRFRLIALGTCLRAIANPRRGRSPAFVPIRMVMLASPRRMLFLNTWLKSLARVSLSCRGNDSLTESVTLRRKTCSALGAPRLDHTAPTASLHACPKPVGSGALEITGLKSTFHNRRLGLNSSSISTRRANVLVEPRHVNI